MDSAFHASLAKFKTLYICKYVQMLNHRFSIQSNCCAKSSNEFAGYGQSFIASNKCLAFINSKSIKVFVSTAISNSLIDISID